MPKIQYRSLRFHYNPPPNPAKLTDSRSGEYVRKYGDDSWEMDALPAKVTNEIIRNKVAQLRDDAIWEESLAVEEIHKSELRSVSVNWAGAVKGAKKKPARRKKSTTPKK